MLIQVRAVLAEVRPEDSHEGRDREDHHRVSAREERTAKAAKPRFLLERIASQIVDGREVVGIGTVPQPEREDGERTETDHATSTRRCANGCEKA